MNKDYLNIYNNLVNITRNKLLFSKIGKKDSFSERLIIFLLHFAFFLKIYKKKNSKTKMQEIYDFVFKQIELSIREIGYGDASINKKMKSYINLFYSIIDRIEEWEKLDFNNKSKIFYDYLEIVDSAEFFIDYFEKYSFFLTNNTLNLFTKDIIKLNFIYGCTQTKN